MTNGQPVDDQMIPNMMGAPENPSKQKKWIIISILSSVLFFAAVIVAIIIVSNARTDVRDCKQMIADTELDVTAAEAELIDCREGLEEMEMQKIGEIDASSKTIGFQYPFGTHVSRHTQSPSNARPIIEYRLNHDVLESCEECSPGGQTTLRIHTYDLSTIDLEPGEKYARRIVDNYNGDDYQGVSTEKQNEKNGELTLVSGEVIGGYASSENPIPFETYVFEADKYVVVAWLDLSGGVDDDILNFFRETIDTSKIE